MPRGTRLFAQNYVRHNGRGNCFLARLLDWHSYKARPFHARFNGAERHRSSSTLQRWLSQPQDAGDQKRSSKSSTLHRQSHQPRKAGLVPQLRCTEFGPMGQVLIANGRLKKTELVTRVSMQLLQSHSLGRQYGLLPRDMRKIDTSNLPHIDIRPTVILLNLLYLKVLIKRDRVLLFDMDGTRTSSVQASFVEDLQTKMRLDRTDGVAPPPYEFEVLDAVLNAVVIELGNELESVRTPVISLVAELEENIDRQKLRMLLKLSKQASAFEHKAKLVRTVLDDILESNDSLSALYLTDNAQNVHGPEDLSEVESMLESYYAICDEIAQDAQSLTSMIKNTDDIVQTILDTNRNSLMLLHLKFISCTLALGTGTFVASFYGMNIQNVLTEADLGFVVVSAGSVTCIAGAGWFGLRIVGNLKRVTMKRNKGFLG
ncbi:Mitochondrial inner membrane magnesium transporter mrs2 [Metarhizium anisopliae]